MQTNDTIDNIVFYDGNCGFCNSSVQFILDHKRDAFFFASLQSNHAKKWLSPHGVVINLDTIYFLKAGKLYDKSSAALQIAKGLKGLYPLLFIFYLVPKFLRDLFYTYIAKRRHRIRSGYCMMPDPEDLPFFLKD